MGASASLMAPPDDTGPIIDRIRGGLAALTMLLHLLNRRAQANIGFELELSLVDRDGRPLHYANLRVLKRLRAMGIKRLVAELGSWQVELNSTPTDLVGRPFTQLLEEASELIDKVNAVLGEIYPGAQVALVGTLPTLRRSDLVMSKMTRLKRYRLLEQGLWRGRRVRQFFMPGPDGHRRAEWFNSVAPEAACTSGQAHLLLPAGTSLVDAFNTTIAVGGVVASTAVNAPFWLGQESAADIRHQVFLNATNGQADWAITDGYISDILEPLQTAADCVRFPIILCKEDTEDPEAVARTGRMPKMVSFVAKNGQTWPLVVRVVLHTGTEPHLRLEFRFASAGPTMRDNLATYAFMIGLVLNPEFRQVWRRLPYRYAIKNLNSSSRYGADARLYWPAADGTIEKVDACELTHQLLPYAEAGLRSLAAQDALHAIGISHSEISEYLGIIARRADKRQTGSSWQTDAVAMLRKAGYSQEDAVRLMFQEYLARSRSGLGPPVCDWEPLCATMAA